MKKKIQKDKKNREYLKKKEYQYIFLKSMLKNKNLYNKDLKIIKKTQLNLNNSNLNRTEIRNFCSITGRSNGVYAFTKLSRMQIRKLNSLNLITGLQKSS